jgi:hypothetical protein
MAPLLKELSSIEVETLEIVVPAPGREGLYTPQQDSNLDTLTFTSDDLEIDALLMGTLPVNEAGCAPGACCCCCCPCCCC